MAGAEVLGPGVTPPPPAATSRRDWDQLSVDVEIAVDLPRRRVPALDQLPSGSTQAGAEGRIGRQQLRASLELNLVAEAEAGDAVFDQGSVAFDVGGQHCATERKSLEHGVGHPTLGDRAVQHDVADGEERAHLGVGHGADPTGPGTSLEGAEERVALVGVEDGPDVEEAHAWTPGDDPFER